MNRATKTTTKQILGAMALAGLVPHLDCDEIEVYLWMFFNAWAACYRPEAQAFVEHPPPVLGFGHCAYGVYKAKRTSENFFRRMGRRVHEKRMRPKRPSPMVS